MRVINFLINVQIEMISVIMLVGLENINNWIFTSAIGELRGLFGVMIGQIAKAYGLDVEDELAQIIPQ